MVENNIKNSWVEIHLTKDQLDLLENSNLIHGGDYIYSLGLGEFFKLEYKKNSKENKYYMTTDIKLLPDYVLDYYREIILNIHQKLNSKINQKGIFTIAEDIIQANKPGLNFTEFMISLKMNGEELLPGDIVEFDDGSKAILQYESTPDGNNRVHVFMLMTTNSEDYIDNKYLQKGFLVKYINSSYSS